MRGEVQNESAVLAAGNVSSRNCVHGALFPVFGRLRKDIRRRITGRPRTVRAAVRNYLTNPEVFMQREGTLHIVRVNPRAHHEVPWYHVGFADYQSGAAKMKTILGNEPLRSFLSSAVGVSPKTIESTIDSLKTEGIANIFDVVLADDTLAKLGLL